MARWSERYLRGSSVTMTSTEEEILTALYCIRDNLADHTDYEKLIDDLRPLLPSVRIAMDGFANQPFHLDPASQVNYIYRAMPIDEGGKRWDTEEEISYLPERLAYKSKLNRANRKGDRLFYGSVHPLSAMIETYASGYFMDRVVAGHAHECIIGVWEVVEPITFASVPFSERAVTKLLARRTFIPDKSNPVTADNVKAQLNYIRTMLKDEFGYKVLELFADAFGHANEEQYLLSTYYAERLFNKVSGYQVNEDVSVEGIFYFAIPSSFEIRNVALPPHVVTTRLRLRKAHHYLTKFDKAEPIPFFHPVETYVPVRNGQIQWRKPYQVK